MTLSGRNRLKGLLKPLQLRLKVPDHGLGLGFPHRPFDGGNEPVQPLLDQEIIRSRPRRRPDKFLPRLL